MDNRGRVEPSRPEPLRASSCYCGGSSFTVADGSYLLRTALEPAFGRSVAPPRSKRPGPGKRRRHRYCRARVDEQQRERGRSRARHEPDPRSEPRRGRPSPSDGRGDTLVVPARAAASVEPRSPALLSGIPGSVPNPRATRSGFLGGSGQGSVGACRRSRVGARSALFPTARTRDAPNAGDKRRTVSGQTRPRLPRRRPGPRRSAYDRRCGHVCPLASPASRPDRATGRRRRDRSAGRARTLPGSAVRYGGNAALVSCRRGSSGAVAPSGQVVAARATRSSRGTGPRARREPWGNDLGVDPCRPPRGRTSWTRATQKRDVSRP